MKDAACRFAVLDSRSSILDPRWVSGVGVGLLMVAVVVLGSRRLAGALDNPLEPLPLLAVALAIAGSAVAVRVAWRSPPSTRSRPLDLLSALGLSASVLMIGAALSLPGCSTVGLIVFWSILGLEECWAWWPSRWRGTSGGVSAALPGSKIVKFLTGSGDQRERVPGGAREASIDWRPSHPAPAKTFRIDSPAESPTPHGMTELDESPAADVTQRLVRSQTADGNEVLAGWLRISLASGQRIASVHVAFCPPFSRTPTLSVEQLDGPPGRLKTVQLLPYGARFDLKLSQPCDEPADALLSFSAGSQNEPGPE